MPSQINLSIEDVKALLKDNAKFVQVETMYKKRMYDLETDFNRDRADTTEDFYRDVFELAEDLKLIDPPPWRVNDEEKNNGKTDQ